jgi:hypothetical protein
MGISRRVGAAIDLGAAIMRTIAILGALVFCAPASAGSVTGATITNVLIGTNYGGMIFIEVSSAKSGNPSCSTNSNWGFVLPLTTALENQMLAVILSARTTGATVTLTGSGVCDTYSNVETLQDISY